ncbi:hypothetical protein NQZ68_029796 [Dissostichus eleginoides]|nr:hypothetical protein NQZ68_029796 [Dissostichus eleginoides]
MEVMGPGVLSNPPEIEQAHRSLGPRTGDSKNLGPSFSNSFLTGPGSPDPPPPIPPPFSSRNTTGKIIWRGIKPSVERQVSFSE